MRGIPPRTMSDVWWGRKEKIKEKTIIVRKVIRERAQGLDEEAVREILREYTEDVLNTLAEKITNRAFSSGVAKRENQVEIKTAFIDPSEEVEMEHNFERLGKVEKSQTDIQDVVESLKKIKPEGK